MPNRWKLTLVVSILALVAVPTLPACGSDDQPAHATSVRPSQAPGVLSDPQDRLTIAYDPTRLVAHLDRSDGKAMITLEVRDGSAEPDGLAILPTMNAELVTDSSIDETIRTLVGTPGWKFSAVKLNGVRGMKTSHTSASGSRTAMYDLYTPHGQYTVVLRASAKTAETNWPLLTSTLRGLSITP